METILSMRLNVVYCSCFTVKMSVYLAVISLFVITLSAGQDEEEEAMIPPRFVDPMSPAAYYHYNEERFEFKVVGSPPLELRLIGNRTPMTTEKHHDSQTDTVTLKVSVNTQTSSILQCEASNHIGKTISPPIKIEAIYFNKSASYRFSNITPDYVQLKCVDPRTNQKAFSNVRWNTGITYRHYVDINGSLHITNLQAEDAKSHHCNLRLNSFYKKTFTFLAELRLKHPGQNPSSTQSSVNTPIPGSSALRPSERTMLKTTRNPSSVYDSTTTVSSALLDFPSDPTPQTVTVDQSSNDNASDVATSGPETVAMMITTRREYFYGDSMTLECMCLGTTPNKELYMVNWTTPKRVNDRANVQDRFHRKLTIHHLKHADSGDYGCACNSNLVNIHIQVKEKFLWKNPPVPVTILKGLSARFSCAAGWSSPRGNAPTVNIIWFINMEQLSENLMKSRKLTVSPNKTILTVFNTTDRRDSMNIQCRFTDVSAKKELFYTSYLQVIEPIWAQHSPQFQDIDANKPPYALSVTIKLDPLVKRSKWFLKWFLKHGDDYFLLQSGTYMKSLQFDYFTPKNWTEYLGTYICQITTFVETNLVETQNVTFVIARKPAPPTNTGVLLAGSIPLVILVVITFVLFKSRKWIKTKWQRRKKLQEIKFRLELAKYGKSSRYVTFPTHKDEFPIDRLHFLDTLGAGNFGKVMKAEALDVNGTGKWETIAVKMCKDTAADAEKENLYHETVIMRKLPKHINVVSYLGYVASLDPVLLLMEYVPGGNLLNYLRQRRPQKKPDIEADGGAETARSTSTSTESEVEVEDCQIELNLLSSRDLSSFALQIAKGMYHVASSNIIHRDLAARNVLLGLGNICKISDFGLARDMEGSEEYEITSQGPLPIRWMAPESLTDGLFTHKSDVWSYGVLLWEIVTLGASPYAGQSARQVMMSVKDGRRLEKPDFCADHVYTLMMKCWRAHPGDRPHFSELADIIEQHLESEAEYIKLGEFDVNVYDVINCDDVQLAEERV